MGYTHYWYRPKRLDENNFANAIKDIALLVSYTKFIDNYPDTWYGETPADKVIVVSELNSREINFNGIGEQAHDTFLMALNDNENLIKASIGDLVCVKHHSRMNQPKHTINM